MSNFYIPKSDIINKYLGTEIMKRISDIPTYSYVYSQLSNPVIAKIIDEWSVEYEFLAQSITNHLESLGIFSVNPITQHETLINVMRSQLFNNHAINQRLAELKRAQEENFARKRNYAS